MAESTKGAGGRIGYARVSTIDQDPSLQTDALANADCVRVFVDRMSGTDFDRPELAEALDHLRPDDSLVVWRLDRLGRSLRQLVDTVKQIEDKGADLVSLTESLDTSTPSGRLIFHVFGALAEFESDMIRERTNAGLAAARARGRTGGRPRVLTEKSREMAISMSEALLPDGSRRFTADEIAEAVGASRSTVYRVLAENQRSQ